MRTKPATWTLASLAVAVVALLIAFAGAGASTSTTNAANKAKADGSTVEKLSADFADTDQGLVVLATSIKTSKTQDLILHVSLECALWTEVQATTIAEHALGLTPTGHAEAHVVVWVEVDGNPVKVSAGDADGKIVFCERVHELEIKDTDEDTGNFTLREYLETREANAFNWWRIDLGSGTHTIEVLADIEASNTQGSYAEGAIGKRTLLVDPVRF